MASEVTLGSLRDSLTTPSNEDMLRQAGVRVFYFDKTELYFPFREVLDQVY